MSRVILHATAAAAASSTYKHHMLTSTELLGCVSVVTIVCCQLLDFGLARMVDFIMSGYVVTRWYRAPEVILNYEHYTQAGG